ncbi:DUF58 domain-containing protein [bacterium]|nr:DUF58 domain-containing protein [bacterium]
MKTDKKYLDPLVVSRISRLDLIARLVVEGFITGLHKSPYHGFSVEFSEYRPYMTGDSIKNIDWKVLGRTERFYVKQFQEETNLRAHILIDASNSMTFGSSGITKLAYAKYLAAALSYMLLKQRDAVGLAAFDSTIRSYLPPRSVMSYLNVMLSEIDHLQGGNDTSIANTFHELAERIKRRGLIIILSDLLDNQDEVLKALKHFRHRKHEVIVFHILDKRETDLNFSGNVLLEDSETGDSIPVETLYVKNSYKSRMKEFIDRYRRECRLHHIDYLMINTEENFATALTKYLVKRKMIGA